MYCVKKMTEDLYWVGGNDRRLALFENVYPIPRGVSYNAYVVLDEKTVLLDTVDHSVSPIFFENLAHVLNGRKLDYPIYYDTEASTSPNGTGRADGLGKEDRTKCAIAFCEEVKSLGYKPGVYASTTWFRKRVDLDALRKYTIWNAHYGVSSSPIDCDMWQGTEKARINGYSGELDANISYMG